MIRQILQNMALGVSLAAPIGPVALAVIKRGLDRGFYAAFIVGLGSAFGDLSYMLATYLGLYKFLNYPAIKTTVWAVGALLLLFLGLQSIRDGLQQNTLSKAKEAKENKNAFILGFVLAIINPVSFVWWLGVFGAILGEDGSDGASLLFSSLAIICGVVLWFLAFALFLNFGRRFVNEKRIGLISVIAGSFLVAFSLKFGYKVVTTLPW